MIARHRWGAVVLVALVASLSTTIGTDGAGAGSHYVIGLVHDDEARWHSAVGPYSTIPFRMRNGRLVAFNDCRVDVTDCESFPSTLAGQTYGSLKAELKAAR